ncbi:MAG: DUF1003 domain-containing protein [Patescibacteria group bacterium]
MKSLRHRSQAERIAEFLTNHFGNLWFLLGNVLLFALWIVINLGKLEGVPVFDPYPFNLLTMVVSLEAIFLSVIVLISQNKASNIDEIREEINFRVNVQAEKEITKMLQMLETIERKLKINNGRDRKLKVMEKELNIERIAQEVIRERL